MFSDSDIDRVDSSGKDGLNGLFYLRHGKRWCSDIPLSGEVLFSRCQSFFLLLFGSPGGMESDR